jgi:molybdopterin-biosynthesis enzyme MoeA-like protein
MDQYRLDLENELKQSPIHDSALTRLIHTMARKKHTARTNRIMAGLIAASIIGLLAFGILVSPTLKTMMHHSVATTVDTGDFIIQKDNHRILVASNISESEITKSVSDLRKNKTKLVWYSISENKLYEDLTIGEQVTVKPKTFMQDGKEMSLVLTSDPPIIDAGIVIRHSKQKLPKNELHKTISADEIVKVSMGKWVYGDVGVEHVEVELSPEDMNNVRTWFNSVPDDRIQEVGYVNPNLAAGIVFELKSNAEVRIQYDNNDVYVTRTEPKLDSQVMYVVDYAELKSFFDEKLMVSITDAITSEGVTLSPMTKIEDHSILAGITPMGYKLDDTVEAILVYDFGSEEKRVLGEKQFQERQKFLSSYGPIVYKFEHYLILYYSDVASRTPTPELAETKYGEKLQKAINRIGAHARY